MTTRAPPGGGVVEVESPAAASAVHGAGTASCLQTLCMPPSPLIGAEVDATLTMTMVLVCKAATASAVKAWQPREPCLLSMTRTLEPTLEGTHRICFKGAAAQHSLGYGVQGRIRQLGQAQLGLQHWRVGKAS